MKTITKKTCLILVAAWSALAAHDAHAQNITATTPWVWMGGDSTINQPGLYGTKGVPGSANRPGARKQSASWTDDNGNFWLFGGRREASSVSGACYNDLWKYSPATHQWTWVSGDTIPYTAAATGQGLVAGTQGVPAVTNQPGARSLANHWKDADGNFWIQGGGASNGGVRYNDLWKYDVTNNTWTWIRGNTAPAIEQAGVYGILGTSSPANIPGSRIAGACWTDDDGFLWLFGGQGVTTAPSASSAGLSDLWKYNIITNEWTWVGGSNAAPTANQLASYGTMGVAAVTNKPGGRTWPITWVDTGNNLWMMGGLGYGETTTQGVLNDLWKYNTVSNQWTWMNGSNIVNHQGTYVSQGISGVGRMPRCRFGSTSWTDKAGDFWLFGGVTIAWQNLTVNDIWKYNRAANEWVWIKGDSVANIQPVYNTLQVPSQANEVGSRGVEMSWRERTNNNIWVFGGYCMQGTSVMVGRNDLWKIETCTPLGTLSSISGADTVCYGDTVSFSIPPVAGAFSYNWQVPAGWTKIDSAATLNVAVGNTGGTVSVRVLGQCGDSSIIQSHTVSVEVLNPQINTAVVNDGTLLSVIGSYATYQWYKNGQPVPGATNPTYTANVSGAYAVRLTSAAGCTAMSDSLQITPTGIRDVRLSEDAIKMYPNPSSGILSLESASGAKIKFVRIVNLLGQELFQTFVGTKATQLNISELNTGLYFVFVQLESGAVQKKLEVKK